jgi:hypothetical protein
VTQPPTYPPPPRRRTSPAAVLLVAGVAIVVAAAIVVMAASGNDGTQPAAAGGAPALKASTHPARTGTDHRFTFHTTHINLDAHVKGINGPDFPKGRFVKVWVSVHNQASRPRFVSADDQQLHAGGKVYGVDVGATVDVDEGPEIVLVFDVPKTANPTALEVHGDTDTAGALISLPTAD